MVAIIIIIIIIVFLPLSSFSSLFSVPLLSLLSLLLLKNIPCQSQVHILSYRRSRMAIISPNYHEW